MVGLMCFDMSKWVVLGIKFISGKSQKHPSSVNLHL